MRRFRSLDIDRASKDDIAYVVRRMRPEDEREVFGARWTNDREHLIAEMQAVDGNGFTRFSSVRRHGVPRPVALIGIMLVAPHVGQANLIATPEWPLVVKDLSRCLRDDVIPDCARAGMTRVELRALASWTQNCAWLEWLGAKRECLVPGFGREPYVQYAWTIPPGATMEA
jgi:hypothetical protein